MEKIIKELYGEKYLSYSNEIENELKKVLDERKFQVLYYYYEEKKSYSEIAKIFNLTRQRIGQMIKYIVYKVTSASFMAKLNILIGFQNEKYPNKNVIHIKKLGLSNRSYNALINAGIQTTSELLEKLNDLKNIKGIWGCSVLDIYNTLYENGYTPLPGGIYNEINEIINKHNIPLSVLIEGLQNVQNLQKQ